LNVSAAVAPRLRRETATDPLRLTDVDQDALGIFLSPGLTAISISMPDKQGEDIDSSVRY
jgi:hypothetical protein